MAAPLIDVYDLVTVVGVDVTGPASFAKVQLSADVASAAVRGWCRQTFTSATSVVRLRRPDDGWLHLPERPVVSVESVTVNGSAITADVVVESGGRIWIGSHFQWSDVGFDTNRDTVEVAYTHGYATVPADVAAVTLMVAARHFSNPTSVRRESLGTYSVEHPEVGGIGLVDGERFLLRDYRPSR